MSFLQSDIAFAVRLPGASGASLIVGPSINPIEPLENGPWYR